MNKKEIKKVFIKWHNFNGIKSSEELIRNLTKLFQKYALEAVEIDKGKLTNIIYHCFDPDYMKMVETIAEARPIKLKKEK